MGNYVVGLDEVDRTQVASVGGKGANLGELAGIDGVRVPAGCCVTTEAYRKVLSGVPSIDEHLDRLQRLDPDDLAAIRAESLELRRAIEAQPVPTDLALELHDAIAGLGEHAACAVRSSATAEDQAFASFAGQQDTYLNVITMPSILEHVRRCWASLFTERAVAYRLRHDVDHATAHMAVVVQRMVVPDASGVMFTADPVTSDRTVVSIEAVLGLGDALVSGTVVGDAFSVRDGGKDGVVSDGVVRTIADKTVALRPAPGGGVDARPLDPALGRRPALTDDQVLRLARLGRRIEAHFGAPQDIEWCLVDDEIHIVQSRPITTLFPIPVADDDARHVYVSVGHQQMMTDPMQPLGLSVWQLTAKRPMHHAGGRLFVDVADALASPATRDAMVQGLGASDPLIGDALQRLVDRAGFLPAADDAAPDRPAPGAEEAAPIATDPAIVSELIERCVESLATLRRDIATVSGPALLDLIVDDLDELRRLVFDPVSHRVIMTGMEAAWWLNDRLREWLGEQQVADTLTQSVPHNVTSEMGLALLDVADVIRPHPAVVAFLRDLDADIDADRFLDQLAELDGGPAAREAIEAFLERYGMRCVGEIDITRPRWSERPASLVPVILGNVANAEPGAAARRFEQGRRQALAKERDVLDRLRALPDGERRAEETKAMIDRVRTFAGYREYPKYVIVNRYFVYRQALLREAARLVRADVLDDPEDIFFLTFDELRDAVTAGAVDRRLIVERREAFRSFATLTPPRVLTSDGEVVAGEYRRDEVPDGALVGLPVSIGTVEGRARVIRDMTDADVEPGDILVTVGTDPSWSPLFVAIAGLVTEVGGQMTHGAVVAREYGLPAVVGVEHATTRIVDGQRIRVHGTDGYVEILSSP